MAEKKKNQTTDLDKKLAELRVEMLEQLRAIKTGTSTNVRKSTHIRREIARTLTLKNTQQKGDAK
ncbi:MAG: 50S ribosomal protein L29 [Patescibacteria group bacterium]